MQHKTYKIATPDGHELVYRGYYEGQKGNPIVFIHGLVASIDFFADDNYRQLSELGPVYTCSLPGHAPSSSPRRFKLTTDVLADTLAAQLRAIVGLSGRRATLVGHSTGATSALAAAIKYPELVETVVVCEGAAHGLETSGIFYILQKLVLKGSWLGTFLFKSIFRINGFRPWTNRFFVADLFANSAKMHGYPHMWTTQAKYWPALQALDLDIMKEMFGDLASIDLRPSLHKLNRPTLVMIGEKDHLIPRAEADTIGRLVPDARTVVISEGGHLPFFETPEVFEREIVEFVRSARAAWKG